MKPNLLGRNASMVLGLMLATVPGFSKTPVSDVRLTVRVFDYVNLPAGARSEVAATATRVLAQAGVAVEFVECFTDGLETGAQPARLRSGQPICSFGFCSLGSRRRASNSGTPP